MVDSSARLAMAFAVLMSGMISWLDSRSLQAGISEQRGRELVHPGTCAGRQLARVHYIRTYHVTFTLIIFLRHCSFFSSITRRALPQNILGPIRFLWQLAVGSWQLAVIAFDPSRGGGWKCLSPTNPHPPQPQATD
jgi:hypothetical protein